MEFQAWPKISRLRRECVITEKIDGTNAAVLIENITDDVGARYAPEGTDTAKVWVDDDLFMLQAQSRSRLITPNDDNFGFARWAYDNAESLVADLGEGRHFGEWWGQGIQRGYGLTEKRFSLFNVNRWEQRHGFFITPGIATVPIIARSTFSTYLVDYCVNGLAIEGSVAAPGFMNPEGVVVFHSASQSMFKVTCDDDEKPKGSTE